MQIAVTLRNSWLLFILNTRRQISKWLDKAVAALLPYYWSGAEHDLLSWRCLNAKQEYVEHQHTYIYIYTPDINSKHNCLFRTLLEFCTGIPPCQSHALIIWWLIPRTTISIVFKLYPSLWWPNRCPDVLKTDCITEKLHKHQKAPSRNDWKSSKNLIEA